MTNKILVNELDRNKRIDRFLSEELEGVSRNQVQELIKTGKVWVNNQKIKANYRLRADDLITYELEEENWDLQAQEMDLEILYEDEDLLIVNKPAGLIVHPAASTKSQKTLVHGLLAHTQGHLSAGSSPERPGIVHRLDKDTSGLLLVAKNNMAQEFLQAEFKNQLVDREYLAILSGNFPHKHAHVDAPIGRDLQNRQKMAVTHINGKEAQSDFYQMESHAEKSLVRVKLHTGRTHQIRLHSLYMGFPVLGDEIYGRGPVKELAGHALHAFRLSFTHPRTKERLSFESQMPQRFLRAIEEMRSGR